MPKRTRHLVIVESPAKARTLSRYLDGAYEVAASVGHVMDLPRRELGVDVERGFQPTWQVIRGKGKVVAALKRKARSAERILLATDPDREGEAIAGHLARQLGYAQRPERFGRIRFREVTRSAVLAALRQPTGLDIRRIEAQQARRILDRLVGYQVSPFLWGPLRPGLSAGRVQTVALRLICEREDEIRAFETEEYWSIVAHLRARDQAFEAKLHTIDGRSFRLGDEAAAEQAAAEVRGVPFEVGAVKRRERRKNPAAPFTTSTLQQEAAKRLRFGAKRTMATAQRLYEGVELGPRGPVGLITYMRTDSTRVSEGAARAARQWVGDEFGAAYLPRAPRLRWGGRQKGAQDAHEAIRPTDPAIHPREAARFLDSDGAALYELIWLRFVASQMAPAVYDTTTLDFPLVGGGRTHLYRATGSVVKFAGFTRLYLEAREEGDRRRLDDLEPVPAMERGERAALERLEPRQHFTRPPPRFSEASLVKELESRGIGRPSTYAAILSTLVDRDYVVLEKRRFVPTDLGEVVVRLLVRVFPDIFDVAFTSRMEDELDRVEEGDLGWRELLGRFYPRLRRRLTEGRASAQEVVREILQAEGESCERCGRPMVVKFNRRGSFLGCSGYPDCRSTRGVEGSTDAPLGIDPESGRTVRVKVGPYGPYVEREAGEPGATPQRAGLPEGTDPESVTLESALRYLSLPRSLGTDPGTGQEVVAGLGRYGPYVKRGRSYADLPGPDHLFTIGLADALRLLEARKASSGRQRVLKEVGVHPGSGAPVRVVAGRYGPYVTDGSLNANVPKTLDPAGVDLDTALELLARRASRRGSSGRPGRRGGGGGRGSGGPGRGDSKNRGRRRGGGSSRKKKE